jgi:hypothetical protein
LYDVGPQDSPIVQKRGQPEAPTLAAKSAARMGHPNVDKPSDYQQRLKARLILRRERHR